MLKNARFCVLTALAVLLSSLLFADGITTAGVYFKSVSDYYSSIKDYEASVDISAARREMAGRVSFKKPGLLRIDFSNPPEQVIVFNGDMLTVYLPEAPAVLQQSANAGGGGLGGASLGTPSGLTLLSRYYVIAYEIGQEPVPLEEGSSEQVIKLVLNRRTSSEAFRSIKLAVSADSKLIRRVQAVTPRGEVFVFNFTDYKLNQDISDRRFIYDPPSSANNYNNFLFSE